MTGGKEWRQIPAVYGKSEGGRLLKTADARIRKLGTDVAGTVVARYHKGVAGNGDNMVMEVKRVGNLYGFGGGNYAGNVYDAGGISPTIRTHSGGGAEPMILEDRRIVAMRGRNPENPSDRRSGIPTEQRLEPAEEGVCNTLTSVAKDNMVLEADAPAGIAIDDRGLSKEEPRAYAGVAPALRAQAHGNLPKVVEEAGDDENGGAAYAMPDGTTAVFRIRRLTPRECWRLMDFSDEDYDRAAAVNSETQLYTQAGNSLVRKVMAAIFSQLGIAGVKPWNERTDGEKRNT